MDLTLYLQDASIATYVESVALDLVSDLLGFERGHFAGRTVTTGATASNVLGLALGRQFVVSQIKGLDWSVAEDGFGGVEVDIFVTGAHASIRKAAALVGIGRSRVKDLTDDSDPNTLVAFDLRGLEEAMLASKRAGRGVIVCPAYGEVNTVGSPVAMDVQVTEMPTYVRVALLQ